MHAFYTQKSDTRINARVVVTERCMVKSEGFETEPSDFYCCIKFVDIM